MKEKLVPILIKAALLCLSVPLFFRLSVYGFLLLTLVCIVVLGRRWKKSGYDEQLPLILLGFVAPWSSFLGPGTLLLTALLFALLLIDREDFFRGKFACPFLSVIWLAALSLVIVSFDPFVLLQVFEGKLEQPSLWEGVRNISIFFKEAPPDWLLAIESALRFSLIVLLFVVFKNTEKFHVVFMRGFVPGLIVAAILTVLNLSGLYPLIFPNQNIIWDSLHRQVGTFSDPNAYGIFSALILPILVGMGLNRKSRGVWGLALGWLVLGGLSGSRSFFFSLFIYLAGICVAFGKRTAMWGFGALLSALVVLNVLSVYEPEKVSRAAKYLPLGAERVVRSVQFDHMKEALFSRSAFWSIAIQATLENPVAGLGFYQFRNAAPLYALKLGLPTGVWTDNANNFYLGLLSELGILGLLAFFLTLLGLSFKTTQERLAWGAKFSLIALAILLVFGPHLDFDEIAVLCAVLMALALEPIDRGALWNRASAILVLVSAVFIVVKSLSLPYGFYRFEQVGASFARWSTGRARGEAFCNKQGSFTLKMAALTPELPRKPLEVQVSSSKESSLLNFSNGKTVSLELACSDPGNRESYEVNVSRIFVPANYKNYGADYRALGVQIFGLPELPGE